MQPDETAQLKQRIATLEREMTVLKQRGYPYRGVRKRSANTLWGLPLYDIAMGPDPDKGELRGHARGVIAIGDFAAGVIAIGGIARGVIAMGGLALGLLFGMGGPWRWITGGRRTGGRRTGDRGAALLASSLLAVARSVITPWAAEPLAPRSSTPCGRTPKRCVFSMNGCRFFKERRVHGGAVKLAPTAIFAAAARKPPPFLHPLPAPSKTPALHPAGAANN
jgi:hypothetical protein